MLNFGELSLAGQIVLIVFALSALIQFIYLFAGFIRIGLYRNHPEASEELPVSVIICARNEERNLRELIPILMSQDYPRFEIVVVNDASWDSTAETLHAFQVTYPNLHVVQIDEDKQIMAGKKFALTLGIKGAKYDHLVLTDADCRPRDAHWIRSMVSGFSDQHHIVLGISPYNRESGFLNWMIRSDAFQIIMMYLTSVKWGMPYMGVGRNMAYTKDTFFSVGGFKSHYALPSGDDDLFIRDAANKKNTTFSIATSSQTTSEPKKSWKAWITQKRRHFTTAPLYKTKTKIFLGLWPLTWLMMLVSGIWLATFNIATLVVLCVLGLRLVSQIVIFSHSSKKLGLSGVGWTMPFSETLLILMSGLLGVANVFNKPKKWM